MRAWLIPICLFLLLPSLTALETETRIAASLVKLPSENMTLQEALAELRKTGNHIEVHNPQSYESPNPRLTGLPTAPQPFLQFLDRIAAEAHFRVGLRPAE